MHKCRIIEHNQPTTLMPSDGADFWKHRKCYGRVFTLVKDGATASMISPLIVDGMAFEMRRFAPQIALKPGIKAVSFVLQALIARSGGLFDESQHARASLKMAIDGIRRQFGEHESTRLICDGLAGAAHSFINAAQSNSFRSLEAFETEALKAVYREQAAHNIIDPLRDYHLRFQGLAPDQYDSRQIELLNKSEADGLLLMRSCLNSKSGVPSKHWRTGGKATFKNDFDSLNTPLD